MTLLAGLMVLSATRLIDLNASAITSQPKGALDQMALKATAADHADRAAIGADQHHRPRLPISRPLSTNHRSEHRIDVLRLCLLGEG